MNLSIPSEFTASWGTATAARKWKTMFQCSYHQILYLKPRGASKQILKLNQNSWCPLSTVQRCLSGQSKSAHGINLRFEFSNSWLLSNTIIWHTIPKSKLSLSISPWITKWSSELSFISIFPSKSWRHQHIQLNRLLINITYSRGPKIENCGTPDLTGKAPDFTPPITTDCCRPWSYDLMNRIISPFIPN